MITIIDYGVGNLGSIQNMFRRVGYAAVISNEPEIIQRASKLILPGIGAFDEAAKKLESTGIIPLLNSLVMDKGIPVLGICLGMQLLSKGSEEGTLPGLGWINGYTRKFRLHDSTLRIPHMGWNEVTVLKHGSIMDNLPEEPRFYFTHSYHVECETSEDVMATTEYGGNFHSAVNNRNIYGTQFHPEKSHKFGMKLLENFAKLAA